MRVRVSVFTAAHAIAWEELHRPGPSGRVVAHYRADEVRAAHAARPGKGARTDLSA